MGTNINIHTISFFKIRDGGLPCAPWEDDEDLKYMCLLRRGGDICDVARKGWTVIIGKSDEGKDSIEHLQISSC